MAQTWKINAKTSRIYIYISSKKKKREKIYGKKNQIKKKKTRLRSLQILLCFCSTTSCYSKLASMLHCDFASNQSYKHTHSPNPFLAQNQSCKHTHSPNPFLAPNWKCQQTWTKRKNNKVKETKKGKVKNKKKQYKKIWGKTTRKKTIRKIRIKIKKK